MVSQIIPKTVFVLMIMSLVLNPALCQEENQAFRESVEEILALSDDIDPATLLEELADLKESPVNINRGDVQEISRLFFLTEFQVMVLADHVRKNGNVVTLYELALLPAFDRNTVMLMAPFISLQPAQEANEKTYGRTMVTLTTSTRFISGESEPEGVRSLLKMKHVHGRFSLGLTAENDPGEPFTFINAPGPDFLSGYLEYRGKGLTDRVIVGDYALRIGEGLVFNSSRWMGSWLSSPSFMSGRSAAAPYTSTEENNYFRGVSLVLGNMSAGAVLFASSNKIDARVLCNEDSTATWVNNLVRGGLHVSESQLGAHNSLTETVTGLHLTAGAGKIRGGVTASATWFSLPFRPDRNRPENIHAFDGSRLLNLAADFRAGSGPLLLFGEAGMSLPGSWAATAGLRAKPSGRVTFNLLARHFSPDYHAFHSGAFRAGSGSGNETGMAASLHLEAARHLFVTAAADHYRIPWPRYRSSAPSYGSRIEIKGEYLPRDDISLRLSFSSSSREYDAASETGTALSVKHTRQQAGFVLNCNPAAGLRLTTRASASFISPAEEKGYLLCQDFSYSFRSVPLRLWFRYALCSAGGWDSRLYAWENDLLSSFSVPALYGEMTRTFIMISWKPAERVEARLKYALTESVNDSGSGLKHELKGQVRMVF
ncbi:MAG: hypothetical protein IH592_00205 [Bacteroidales bacterium]|nr:hypothetical protein [Bacteroidales bacterium]